MDKSSCSLYPIIGSPVEQVRSPDYFNRYFSDAGLNARMVAIDVRPSELPLFFDQLRKSKRVGGCVVTVPHKSASAEQVDRLSARAKILGAVNVIRVDDGQLSGDMVDGLGFLAALETHGFVCRGKKIGIVGCGAAGSAIVLAAADSGAGVIAIQERDESRRAFVAETFAARFPRVEWSFELGALGGFDLLVNASPTGMNGNPELPVQLDSVKPNCLIMDLVTKPKVTPWIQAALDRDCEIVYGDEMIQGQFKIIGRFMGLDIPDGYTVEVE